MLSGLKNFIITFCASVLIFGLIAYFVVSGVNRAMAVPSTEPTNTQTPSSDNTADTSDSGTVTIDPDQPTDDRVLTVLLVGTDYQSKFTDYDSDAINQGNTGFPYQPRPVTADSIMLIRIDKNSGTYIFSSIPSNTRVLVDGAYDTLGSLYESKGIDFLRRKVIALTGCNIEYYAAVSIESFAQIIDKVGGVYFTVPTGMYYNDPNEDPDNPIIDISPGARTLSGKEAAAMLRYVSYRDGNRSRMDLSISFAQAALKQLTNGQNISKLDSLFTQIAPLLETNLTVNVLTANSDLLAAYQEFKPISLTYPGAALTQDGVIYYEPDIAQAVSLFRSYK